MRPLKRVAGRPRLAFVLGVEEVSAFAFLLLYVRPSKRTTQALSQASV